MASKKKDIGLNKPRVVTRRDAVDATTAKNKERMLLCLTKSLGVVTTAAKKANIVRKTHYNWLKADPEYARAVEEIHDSAIDVAETALLEQIRDGNIAGIIFYLKCQGKNRGYVEKPKEKPEGNITLKWG